MLVLEDAKCHLGNLKESEGEGWCREKGEKRELKGRRSPTSPLRLQTAGAADWVRQNSFFVAGPVVAGDAKQTRERRAAHHHQQRLQAKHGVARFDPRFIVHHVETRDSYRHVLDRS